MKKIISIAVFPVMLFSLVLFSACEPKADEPDEAAKADLVVVDNEFFTMEVPEGWAEGDAPAGIIKIFYNDAESGDSRAKLMGFKDSFSIALDSKTTLGEDYKEGIKATLGQVLPQATFSDGECFQVDGYDACTIVLDLVQNEIHLMMHLVGIEGEGSDVWLITLTTTEPDYDSSLAVMKGMLENFDLHSVQ
jgi:hypothetical protein